MAEESVSKAIYLASKANEISGKIRRVALIVPTISLVAGAGAMLITPQLGLSATAFILGWTQLVGL